VVRGAVEVRAVQFLAVWCEALLCLKKVRVVLLLLPAVGVRTVVFVRAAFGVLLDKSVRPPPLAEFRRVGKQVWFPPEVLPVMGVHASLSVMILLPVGAPDCFEVEEIEIVVWAILLNHLN